MKKKIFVQLHPSIIFMNCFFLFLMSICISSLIEDPLMNSLKYKNFDRITTLILWYLSFLIVIWIGITYNRHWITFKEKHIYVPSDWRMKRNCQQHRVEVDYENIVDISFIRSTKSSKNKTIQEETLNPFYHQYMVLHLKNGRKERIKIDFYSKKQKANILEELKRRLEYCGNDIDLTNARESLQNLGMFGATFAIDIAEKQDQKKCEKTQSKKKKK